MRCVGDMEQKGVYVYSKTVHERRKRFVSLNWNSQQIFKHHLTVSLVWVKCRYRPLTFASVCVYINREVGWVFANRAFQLMFVFRWYVESFLFLFCFHLNRHNIYDTNYSMRLDATKVLTFSKYLGCKRSSYDDG